MVQYLEALALVPNLFVMDRGFYSAANLAALVRFPQEVFFRILATWLDTVLGDINR
jgi:hypothetical protein